jgi:hypothetical protein
VENAGKRARRGHLPRPSSRTRTRLWHNK